jgi:hypothetical protein
MKKQSYKILLLLFFGTLNLHTLKADEITVHNKTESTIYAATYYQYYDISPGKYVFETIKEFKCIKTGDVQTINPVETKKIERTQSFAGRHRNLLSSINKDDLAQEINNKKTFNKLCHIRIGSSKGDNFYITTEKPRLKAYNDKTWNKKHSDNSEKTID